MLVLRLHKLFPAFSCLPVGLGKTALPTRNNYYDKSCDTCIKITCYPKTCSNRVDCTIFWGGPQCVCSPYLDMLIVVFPVPSLLLNKKFKLNKQKNHLLCAEFLI